MITMLNLLKKYMNSFLLNTTLEVLFLQFYFLNIIILMRNQHNLLSIIF